MLSIPKVMIFLLIVLSTLMYWTTSNVCRYNFVVEKRTNQLNILAAEIDPSIPISSPELFKLSDKPSVKAQNLLFSSLTL